jgi:hypothetical protein
MTCLRSGACSFPPRSLPQITVRIAKLLMLQYKEQGKAECTFFTGVCMRKSILGILLPLILVGCTTERPVSTPGATDESELLLAGGSADAGRKAFFDLRCNLCHGVMEQSLREATTPNYGPVLTVEQASQPSLQLAISIVKPAHSMSPAFAEVTKGSTPMGDYNNVMTVRQLMDLLAYIKSIR